MYDLRYGFSKKCMNCRKITHFLHHQYTKYILHPWDCDMVLSINFDHGELWHQILEQKWAWIIGNKYDSDIQSLIHDGDSDTFWSESPGSVNPRPPWRHIDWWQWCIQPHDKVNSGGPLGVAKIDFSSALILYAHLKYIGLLLAALQTCCSTQKKSQL